ncbi:hypothetical protein PENSPDRAFT_615238, partial [Peniophora sp. CONT]
MHAYESHLRATGQPVSHPIMKEILAAAAAAEVEKLIETKGLTHLDRHRAERMAQEQAHMLAEQRYSGGTGFECAQAQSGPAQAFIGYGGGSSIQYAAPQGPPPAAQYGPEYGPPPPAYGPQPVVNAGPVYPPLRGSRRLYRDGLGRI